MSKLFEPFQCKGLTLKNRIVMPPMCMYVAPPGGEATEWHKVHYGARAVGGAGLIIQEATAVEKRGRLSDHDLGLWSDHQVRGLRSLVDTVHQLGGTMAVQLAHGGRKAWAGGEPVVGPSALAFSDKDAPPHELSREEIAGVVNSFRQAARRAMEAGYDTVEIHGAHGYLIHQFLSPHSNKRTDEFGGSLENRLRFPLQVIEAVKGELPSDIPLLMRVSAVEYLEDGYSFEEMVAMAQAFRDGGVDILDVSTGGASPQAPASWPGFQVPYAEKLREALGIPVIAVGLITSPRMAEEIVANDRADLVAVGRALLADLHWPLQAAAELGEKGVIPKPYERAYARRLF